MEIFATIINAILALGPQVFLPILMIIIGLICKMKVKDAISAGLTLGVAFVGIGLVLNLLIDAVTPAATGFAEATGKNLTTIDVGWPMASGITWAWSYVILIFPIVIGVNIIMLLLKQTKTLNVDLWNVWPIAFEAFLGTYFTGQLWVGLLIAVVHAAMDLKLADAMAKQAQRISGVPGVSCPHPMMTCAPPIYVIDWLLRKIPFFNIEFDVDKLREKIGIFGENHVLGFIIGFLISLVGGLGPAVGLVIGVYVAAAFMLLPLVSKLFMQALAPISNKAGAMMKAKFKDRELYIGLDWPFFGGRSELWVVMIFTIPVTMLFALIMPGNTVLPMASIITISAVLVSLVVCNANIIRMYICTIVMIPLIFLLSNMISPALTSLAASTGAYAVEGGQMITLWAQESVIFRYIFLQIINGNYWMIGGLILFIATFYFFLKDFTRRDSEEVKG